MELDFEEEEVLFWQTTVVVSFIVWCLYGGSGDVGVYHHTVDNIYMWIYLALGVGERRS